MTKTKTLKTLLCALVLGGAVGLVPGMSNAAPAQTVAAATANTTTGTTATPGTKGDPATPAPSDALSVARLLVATSLSEREPVGEASSFAVGSSEKLYGFVEIKNPKAEATTLEIAWLDLATNKEQHNYTLEIDAAKRWRTWARISTPKKPGSWAVLVRDQNGVELARTPFEMTE
jgi:hypothetical protein